MLGSLRRSRSISSHSLGVIQALAVANTYFIGWLGLEFGKYVLRLRLSRESGHGEDWAGRMWVGGKGVELWWG